MNTSFKLISACALSVMLTACVANTPEWDQHFGESVRAAIALQTINPNAAKNTDPVLGIDGKAANETMGRYQTTFKDPPPTANSFTIGIGR
jgi:hypothetical protein